MKFSKSDSQMAYRKDELYGTLQSLSKYFAALNEINYKGYLTIEREVNNSPINDTSEASAFIKKFR